MKVLIVSNYRGKKESRPEAFLVMGLAEKGVNITVMTHSDAHYTTNFQEKGIKVIDKHPTKKYDPEFIQFLRKELSECKYDILHLFNNKAITNGIEASKGLHHKISIYRGASANMSALNPLNYWKFFHPRIDLAICNSEEIKRKFEKSYTYKKGKAITIFKGHQSEWYDNIDSVDIKTEMNISKGTTIVSCIGNYRKVKGFEILLKSIDKLPSNLDIIFLLIGNGIKEKLGSKFIHLIEKRRVHFLGFREDADGIVKASDLFILPSLSSEALTKSVIESIMTSTPCILTDVPGNKPLYSDNTAFIAKANHVDHLSKVILKALDQRPNWKSMARSAKQHIIQSLNTNQTVTAYYNAWKCLIE